MDKMYNTVLNFNVNGNTELDNIINTEVYEAFRNSIVNGGFCGWGSDLYLNEDGEIGLHGVMSYNSQSYDSWQGTEITLATIPAVREVDVMFGYDFTTEEEAILRSWYINYYTLYDEEEELQKTPIHELLKGENIEAIVQEILPSLYDDLLEETIECEWEMYMDDLHEAIEHHIEDYLRYTK